MNRSLRTTLNISLGVLFVLALALYALYQSNTFLSGPELVVSSPTHGELITSKTLAIRGTGSQIARLFLNDRQIFLNEEGRFSEELIALPGYTIISLRAEDKFGRISKEKLEIVYEPI